MVCCWKGMENDNVEVKIIMFVIKPVESLPPTFHDKCGIKVVCQVIRFVSFLSSQLGWIYLIEIIQKLLVIKSSARNCANNKCHLQVLGKFLVLGLGSHWYYSLLNNAFHSVMPLRAASSIA